MRRLMVLLGLGALLFLQVAGASAEDKSFGNITYGDWLRLSGDQAVSSGMVMGALHMLNSIAEVQGCSVSALMIAARLQSTPRVATEDVPFSVAVIRAVAAHGCTAGTTTSRTR